MAELLALASAVSFGVGDFMGGVASRTAAPIRVTAVSQLASAIVLVPLVVLVPAEQVTGADLAWGAAGGVFGMIGVLGLFTGLGRGPMGVVAPVTAVLSAMVPVAVGLALGERPEPLALAGVALGIAAIAGVSAAAGPTGPIDRYALIAAVVAGFGFGLFFVFLGQTNEASGMWPLVTARAASIPVIVLLAASRGGVFPAVASARRLAVGSGMVDMAANGFFVAAVQRGLLSIASVLSALYPVATVVLARVVLGERLSRLQIGGVAVAVVAVAMIGLA